MNWKKGDRAIVKDGWLLANNHYTVLGPAIFLDQWWVPIIDDDGDPTFFKATGLEKEPYK